MNAYVISIFIKKRFIIFKKYLSSTFFKNLSMYTSAEFMNFDIYFLLNQ